MKKYLYILTLGLVFCFSDCGHTRGSEDNDSLSGLMAEQNGEPEDSVLTDSVKEERKFLSFPNVDSLNRYIRTLDSDTVRAYREGIIPLIATYCLDYATRLINSHYQRFIIVDKSRMKVLLFDRYGRLEKSYGMGCAKNYGTKHKKADSRTPEGFFSVAGYYDSTDWLFTDDDGRVSKKKGQFGPRFIRLWIPNTSQIGIHGTCAPWTIGGRVSHGCIRITNENILELVEYVRKGMPVIIVPGKKDILQNMAEGYDIPWIPTSFSARNPMNDIKKEIMRAEETESSGDTVKPELNKPVQNEDSAAENPDTTASRQHDAKTQPDSLLIHQRN